MTRLLPLLLAVFLLSLSSTEGWSLPPCPEDPSKYFDNRFGTVTFDNGEKYAGEWKDDKKHGQGTTIFATGETYVGEWKDNKAHGQGTFTSVNGDKYVGENRDHKRHGQGTYTRANGDKYVGEFSDDKRHGQGTLYAADGTILQEGYWERGEFVRSEDTDTQTNSVTVE